MENQGAGRSEGTVGVGLLGGDRPIPHCEAMAPTMDEASGQQGDSPLMCASLSPPAWCWLVGGDGVARWGTGGGRTWHRPSERLGSDVLQQDGHVRVWAQLPACGDSASTTVLGLTVV